MRKGGGRVTDGEKRYQILRGRLYERLPVLALALGLSDEVQSAAGGIRLDTLFLDEGFGSLDEESLEQAIRVLSGLTEGDRLVGIISHVAALKDRIDRQVVVHKERSGGSWVEIVT